jgi:signal transduction histidine kinase
VDVTGDRPPAEPLALAAYYLVSEALTNIVKHARAGSARVSLTLGDALIVQVSDDGVGGAVVTPGHGLSGLFERVRALGGECWLASPPGGPTVLRAAFPVS